MHDHMSRPFVNIEGSPGHQRLVQLWDTHDYNSIDAFLRLQVGIDAKCVLYTVSGVDYSISSSAELHEALAYHQILGESEPLILKPLCQGQIPACRSGGPGRQIAGAFKGHSDHSLMLAHDFSLKHSQNSVRKARPPLPIPSIKSSTIMASDPSDIFQIMSYGNIQTMGDLEKALNTLPNNVDGLLDTLKSMNPDRFRSLVVNALPKLAKAVHSLKNEHSRQLLNRDNCVTTLRCIDVAALVIESLLRGSLAAAASHSNVINSSHSRILCVFNFLIRAGCTNPEGSEHGRHAMSFKTTSLSVGDRLSDAVLQSCELPVRWPRICHLGMDDNCAESSEIWFCSSIPGSCFSKLNSALQSHQVCLRPELLALASCLAPLGPYNTVVCQGTKRYHTFLPTKQHYLEVYDAETDHEVLCIDAEPYVEDIGGEVINIGGVLKLLNKYLSAFMDSKFDTIACPLPPGKDIEYQCLVLVLAASIANKQLVIYRWGAVLATVHSLCLNLHLIRVFV